MTLQISSDLSKSILDTIKNNPGYVTIDHLARTTGSAPDIVSEFVFSHPEQVRKSKITTDDGHPLFTLNTPLSGVYDAWANFRHVNAKKF